MAEKIRDNRFLRLVRHMLKAGYLEEWEYHDTLSGVPQGGTVSPILSNIYLDKLDKFVEQELIPQYTRGGRRRLNPEYNRTAMRLKRTRKRGDRAEARDLLKQLRTLPRDDPMDPGYRRLKYTRYADDHIMGFIGPEAEAEAIKARLAEFLRETLGLELNAGQDPDHARPHPAAAIPRLRHQRLALQHENHQRPQVGQRENRAESAPGRDHGPKPPPPETRQAVAPAPAPEPGRLRDRPDLRSRVPRRHQLLVRHEAHCSYRPRSGRGPEEVVRGPDDLGIP